MDYTVKLERFEGPYTRLLNLIEERKLSITEIHLSSLADDYIAYIKTLEEKDHLDISLFIVVASTLMLMKVRSLLPKIDYTNAEERQIEDLTHKLHLFAYLGEVSKKMKDSFSTQKVFFSYGKMRMKRSEGEFPKNVTKEILLRFGLELLEQTKREGYVREVTIRKKTSVEEIIDLIRNIERDRFSLREISDMVQDKQSLVLSFISLLELVRCGEYEALQETPADIFIMKSVMLQ